MENHTHIKASDAAALLGLPLVGEDIELDGLSTMSNPEAGTMIFAKKLDEDFLRAANELSNVLVLAAEDYAGRLSCSYILCPNPRLAYLRVVNRFFADKPKPGIHPTAIVGEGVTLGENVSIGAYCVIDGDIRIGDGCRIGNHVSITGRVTLGRDCWLKSGAVLGEEGFGFERNENGEWEHFPHLGRTVIGDRVFIGANSTVEQATIDKTVIYDGSVVDDLVQIGHNTRIGPNALIASGAVICGGAVVGEGAWVAPNVSVREKLTVGRESLVGLGSVVVKNVEDDTVVAGNPARKRG